MTKMTAGHFETVALAVRRASAAVESLDLGWERTYGARIGLELAARALRDELRDNSNTTANGNRAFDGERFMKACGLVDATAPVDASPSDSAVLEELIGAGHVDEETVRVVRAILSDPDGAVYPFDGVES